MVVYIIPPGERDFPVRGAVRVNRRVTTVSRLTQRPTHIFVEVWDHGTFRGLFAYIEHVRVHHGR